MKSAAKFKAGDRVELAFNPPRPDPSVPLQANGKFRGRGDYQTRPDLGTVVEAIEGDGEFRYLVDVELSIEHKRNGKPYAVKSVRKRVVPESKLMAV